MVDRMIRHMLANPVLSRPGVPPRVIVDSACFESRSSQRLNKNILIDRLAMRLQIAANGRILFFDREHADMVEKERALKRDGIADVATGGLTQAVAGADYRLTGRLTSTGRPSAFGARRPEHALRRRRMQPCYHRSKDGSALSPGQPAATSGDVVGGRAARQRRAFERPRAKRGRKRQHRGRER